MFTLEPNPWTLSWISDVKDEGDVLPGYGLLFKAMLPDLTDTIGESVITLVSGSFADLANASWSLPSTAVTLQADTALGGDIFFDSANAMAPIVRYGYEWYVLLNKTYAWIGFNQTRGGIVIYGTSQAANATKIQRILGTVAQPPITGLVGRYRASVIGGADNSAVASWPDISGLRNHATQGTGSAQAKLRTTVFGENSLQFSGAQYYSIPASVAINSQSCSMFFISRNNRAPDNFRVYGALGLGIECLYELRDAPYQQFTTAYFFGVGQKYSNLVLHSGLALHGVTSETGIGIKFIINDVVQAVAATGLATLNTEGGWIGSGNSHTGYSISADMMECLIYNQPLTASDLIVLQNYAYATYPIMHQHTSQVVFVGNSLFAGAPQLLDFQTVPNLVALQLSSDIRIFNQGRGARTTSQMASDAATAITPIYDSNMPINILVVWEVRNDLVVNLASKETALARIQTYCSARKTEGWTVIVLTVLPTPEPPSDFEVNRQWISDQMVSGFVSGGYADAVVDIRANTVIGLVGQNNNQTYYYSDKIHLRAAGNNIVADLISQEINNLLD